MELGDVRELLQNRIIQLMNSNDLSMHQLSRRIGKSPDYVQKVMAGRLIPSLPVIVDICNQFDITIAELFDPTVRQPEKHHQLVHLIQYLPEQQLDGLLLLLSKE